MDHTIEQLQFHPVADLFPLMEGQRYDAVGFDRGVVQTATLIESANYPGHWFVRVTDGGNEMFWPRPVRSDFVAAVLDAAGLDPVAAHWSGVPSEAATSCPWALLLESTPAIAFIYFIQGVTGGPIKIGFAGNPADRLESQIQPMSPVKLRLLGTLRGTVADEQAFHRRFAGLRLHGEWFAPGESLLEFIEAEVAS